MDNMLIEVGNYKVTFESIEDHVLSNTENGIENTVVVGLLKKIRELKQEFIVKEEAVLVMVDQTEPVPFDHDRFEAGVPAISRNGKCVEFESYRPDYVGFTLSCVITETDVCFSTDINGSYYGRAGDEHPHDLVAMKY